MPRWAKLVLIAFVGGFALLAVELFFAGRWIRQQVDTLGTESAEAQREGQRFGTGREADACVGASLERIQGCSTVICETQTFLFTSGCLNAATVPPGYCEEIRTRSLGEECARRGRPAADQRCMRVISMLHAHCGPPPQAAE